MTTMPKRVVVPVILAIAGLFAPYGAHAQGSERSGKDVVDAVCAGCHASGASGAPKIGDRKAWGKRASQGLTSLTQHALKGIRAMPSHGGKLDLTDLEIGRAVAYMVNRSGGKWTEPASAKEMAAERSGAQVVKAQCAKCHDKGVGGAPKIGDRNAWTPRLKDGLDNAVRSAIRGHGGMPARGGMADLTDNEIRAAVTHMFNSVGTSAKPKPKAEPAAASDPTHKLVEGTDVYLGVLPAEAMRTRHSGADSKMQREIPSGKGYYHVSVVLRDSSTKAAIEDAQIEARVANLLTGETKKLEAASINNTVTYGNYFRMPGKDPYTVTVQIRKPGAARAIEARFDLKQ